MKISIEALDDAQLPDLDDLPEASDDVADAAETLPQPEVSTLSLSMPQMREELISIRSLLAV